MRKYLIALLSACVSLIITSCQPKPSVPEIVDGTVVFDSAQLYDTNHIIFKGVQLDGSRDEVIAQLQREAGLISNDTNSFGYALYHINYLDVDFTFNLFESSETHAAQQIILQAPPTTKAEALKTYRHLKKQLNKKYSKALITDENLFRTAVVLKMRPHRRLYATQEGSEVLFLTTTNLDSQFSQAKTSRETDLPIYQVGIVIQDATNAMQSKQTTKTKECPDEWANASNGPHMTFLGVPIKGTRAEFMQQLRNNNLITQVDTEKDEFSKTFGQSNDQVEFCGIHFMMNPVVGDTPDSIVTSVYLICRFKNDSLSALSTYEKLNTRLQQQYGKPKVFPCSDGHDAYSYVTSAGQVKTSYFKGKYSSTSIIDGNIFKEEYLNFNISVEVIDAQGYKQTHRY